MTERVRYTRGAGELVFSLEGEIDFANAGAVEDEIRAALDDESRIVIDLTRTEYLDSAGLRLLFGLARSAPSRVTVVIPEDSALRRVVTLVGLTEVVPIVPELPAPPG